MVFKVTFFFFFKLFPKIHFSSQAVQDKNNNNKKLNLDTKSKTTKPDFFHSGLNLYNTLLRMNLCVWLWVNKKKKVNRHMLTAHQIPEAWRLNPMPFWKTTRGPKIKVPLQLNHSGCLSQTLIITFLPSFFLPCVKHHIAFDWAV